MKRTDLFVREKATIPAFRADRLYYHTGSGFAPIGKLFQKNASNEIEQLYGEQEETGPAVGTFRYYGRVSSNGSSGVFTNNNLVDYSTIYPDADADGRSSLAALMGPYVSNPVFNNRRIITQQSFPNTDTIQVELAIPIAIGASSPYDWNTGNHATFFANNDNPYPTMSITVNDVTYEGFEMTFTPSSSSQNAYFYKQFDSSTDASAWRAQFNAGDDLIFDIYTRTQDNEIGAG